MHYREYFTKGLVLHGKKHLVGSERGFFACLFVCFVDIYCLLSGLYPEILGRHFFKGIRKNVTGSSNDDQSMLQCSWVQKLLTLLRYLRSESSWLWTVPYQASSPKWANCHCKRCHKRSLIGSHNLFQKWISLPKQN